MKLQEQFRKEIAQVNRKIVRLEQQNEQLPKELSDARGAIFAEAGRVTLATKPTNCYDLFITGNQINGFYTVQGSTGTKLKTVYCDYGKAPEETGLILLYARLHNNLIII